MNFVHLHIHTHYSLLDGLSKIDDVIEKAVANGQSAIAITDHGVMYGAIEFFQKCKKAGIKPIIGIEGYLARDGMLVKDASREKRFHVVLLAKNMVGYKNLLKLVSNAHLDGYYYKPRFDFEMLKEHHEGLICLSACLAGEVARAIIDKGIEAAEKVAIKYREVFGDDYYLEVQHHPNIPDQKVVNNAIFEIGKKLNIPIVATSDSHYLNIEDAEAHDILICLQTKKKIHETKRMSFIGEDFSIHTTEQMCDYFRGNLEVIENTVKVADKINLDIPLGEIQLPYYEVPKGKTDFEFLTDMCKQGIMERYGFDSDKPKTEDEVAVVERLNYELGVIEKTGYASYFLIVQDFIVWSKNQGIVVGPGRGSAAGSLVAYVTNITDLDPLKYDLLFERFLNPERVSMPDIDTDFADTRRDEVLRYVENKYGKDHVAQIITFGTMAARAAIRDVGRVLDLPYSFCDQISKLIPPNMSLDNAVNQVVELKNMYGSNSDAKRLIDYARRLEGVARHTSTHACGVVITQKPLIEYTPVQVSTTAGKEAIVTQYSLHPVEDLGLLKMDFLGLKNLTIIEKARELIKKIHGVNINIARLPLDDKKSYELFQHGETTGVFQFESGGMKRYLRKLKPTVFDDLIAMVALYRPGPMQFIDTFIARKHGKEEIKYEHPIMEDALKDTYGVTVYQEQVMRLSKDMAGFTGGEADVLRKAIGKKNIDLMNEMKDKFIAGCRKNKISESTAKQVWQTWEAFAQYCFNKSHAACYALISYQTAYLKANYPAEFMASLLTCDEDNMERVAIEIDECKRMGIDVLPPDINESFTDFTVVADSLEDATPRIRFGMKAVRNIGEGVVKAIIKERKGAGKFTDLDNFISRVKSKDLNKKSLEGLAKSGAMDGVAERSMVLENMDRVLLYIKELEAEAMNNQASLFSTVSEDVGMPKLQLMDYPPATQRQRLSWEKEFLGLYVSDHPYGEYAAKFEGSVTPLATLKDNPMATAGVLVAGVITDVKKIITSKGDPMLFVKIEDNLSSVEVLIFPRLYTELQTLFVEERIVIVWGKVSEKDDEPKILADMAWEVTGENYQNVLRMAMQYEPHSRKSKWKKNEKSKSVIINYPSGASPETAALVKELLAKYPGKNVVFLQIGAQMVKTNFKVRFCQQLLQDVGAILGKNKVTIRD